MSDSLRLSEIIPASPETLYAGWLNSKAHSDFTGGDAVIEGRIGGSFSAWDGYIEGKTLELEPNRRIVQSWRTSQFPSGSKDSRLEVRFEPAPGGTRLTFVHTEIPEGQGVLYEKGWSEFYFEPMRKYFSRA